MLTHGVLQQLALKHRSEKSQRQRIVVFSCSPIEEDEKTLVKLAKKMKKINVSIDVIAFGDLESDQTKKLEAFVENVKGGDGSNLAIIPPGPNLLSEELQVSPILGGDGSGAGAEEGGERRLARRGRLRELLPLPPLKTEDCNSHSPIHFHSPQLPIMYKED